MNKELLFKQNNYLAYFYKINDRLNKSLEYSKKCFELKPNSKTLIYLGRNYLKLNKLDQYEEIYTLLEKEYLDDYAYKELAKYYSKKNDIEKAKEYYLKAIEAYPNEELIIKAEIAKMEGNIEEEIKYLEESIEKKENLEDAIYQLSTVYIRKKDYDKYLEVIQKLIPYDKIKVYSFLSVYYRYLVFDLDKWMKYTCLSHNYEQTSDLLKYLYNHQLVEEERLINPLIYIGKQGFPITLLYAALLKAKKKEFYSSIIILKRALLDLKDPYTIKEVNELINYSNYGYPFISKLEALINGDYNNIDEDYINKCS